MPKLISLFDFTGLAVAPFTALGWETIIIDTQHQDEKHPLATKALGLEITHETELDIIKMKPDVLISFPPCTDLAVSGAAHFAAKRANDPDFQRKATDLARAAERIGELLGIPWQVENPVSRLSTLWRRPDFIFSPNEFGGYLPENDVHPLYPEYIAARDAYPKTTCYWLSKGFPLPPKKPIWIPRGYSTQHLKLGGKSLKTKNIRSATPRGFFIGLSQILGKHADA